MYLNEKGFINFLHEKEITWLGIDFSKAKFTKQGFNHSIDILHHFMNSWNSLIITDQKKYDIRLSFRKPKMEYDLSMVTRLNKMTRINSLFVDYISYQNFYSENEIIHFVSTQTTPQHTTYSLELIVESFDNMTKMASLWVILLKTATNETILCEKFLKSPGGIGTVNYWARTFYNLFFEIQKNAFSRWENAVKY